MRTILHKILRTLGIPIGVVKAFPEVQVIFTDEHEKVSKVIFPLCTIDLSYIDKKYTGEIHLVQFNEDPYREENKKYFNKYCKHNTIGFKIIQGKYKFLADLEYFSVNQDWQEWLNLTNKTYQESKEKNKSNGKTYGLNFTILGGKPTWVQEDETPCDPDGSPMTFIAQYDSGNVCKDNCEKMIYLFYSDKHKLVVQVYQIT